MAISAAQIATTNTLEQFRTEFNILRDDVSGLEDGSVTFSEVSATTLGSSTINVKEDGTIIFEGATDNAFETTLTVVDPTSDHTITFPDQGGLISLIGGIKTNNDDDIVLDDVGSRLLLEDVMDGDTGSFLSSHGVTFANNDVSLSGKLVIGDGETIGSTSDTDSLSISSTGVVNFTQRPTFAASVTIQDGGSIGSSSDLNAVTISSGGVVAVTATTANTSATDGALTVAGGVGIAADLSIGDDVRLISDSAVLSFGADSDVTLTHAADTSLTLNVLMAATTFEPTGDTAAGDDAAFGYTSVLGAILTGQGSTNDVTLVNDADATVLGIPTGTINVTMAGTLDVVGDITGSTLNADGDTSAGDAAAIGYTAAEGLILTGQGSTSDVVIKNDADTTVMSIATGTDDVVFAGDVTVSGNLDVTGTFDLSDSNFTNAGDIQLDSITGDGDTNTSITFSGSDIITFATGGSTAATLNASQVLTLSGNLLIPDAGTIGSASDTDAMSISSGGVVNFSARPTFAASLTIQDGGSLGSASDLNAMTISSGGVVAVTATTASSSSTTGALTVGGGLGVAADLFVGDDFDVTGDAVIDGTALVTGVLTTTAATVFNGGFASNGDSTMGTNKKIIFRDAAIHISSVNDGDLMIVADDEIDITSTLIDINGAVEISGATTQTGISTSAAKDVFNAGMSVKNGATGPGFIEFFEDSDHGTNKVIVQANSADQSYSGDITLTLPAATGTLATLAAAADEATALAIALG